VQPTQLPGAAALAFSIILRLVSVFRSVCWCPLRHLGQCMNFSSTQL
jgi:hypothetical protein